ncbi:MAG: SRPBCC domain-containing protein [Gammaproteobacteria bacterium]|nr:SRPBCC domain-containing protein [Gammaproteobacteria bacterium]
MSTKTYQTQVTQFIQAKREKVFAAWTSVEHIKNWFAPGAMTVAHAECDPRVGGHYVVHMDGRCLTNVQDESQKKLHKLSGVYKEIIPNEKLVFTWGSESEDRVETLVTIEFKDLNNGTNVILTHERFITVESAEQHNAGWHGCLDKLNHYIATL